MLSSFCFNSKKTHYKLWSVQHLHITITWILMQTKICKKKVPMQHQINIELSSHHALLMSKYCSPCQKNLKSNYSKLKQPLSQKKKNPKSSYSKLKQPLPTNLHKSTCLQCYFKVHKLCPQSYDKTRYGNTYLATRGVVGSMNCKGGRG